ncbi:MAG: adenylyl-sulfate kinase [Planctomycetia bacterium]|nr:adenylyl-sulfate kinase [Planctomycetia bacterium]
MVEVYWHETTVSRSEREIRNGHRGCVVWLTGLSASGKSTIANHLDRMLYHRGVRSSVLDGDNVRHSLNASPGMLRKEYGDAFAERFGLGFSEEDREENIRRIGAVSELFCEAGLIAITAFISPYRADRDRVRRRLRAGDFVEVWVDTSLAECERRDPKGLYAKARAGEVKGFTGIDAPYEPPEHPEIHLRADVRSPESLAEEIVEYLRERGTRRIGDTLTPHQ